jgi:hypothetical protein
MDLTPQDPLPDFTRKTSPRTSRRKVAAAVNITIILAVVDYAGPAPLPDTRQAQTAAAAARTRAPSTRASHHTIRQMRGPGKAEMVNIGSGV